MNEKDKQPLPVDPWAKKMHQVIKICREYDIEAVETLSEAESGIVHSVCVRLKPRKEEHGPNDKKTTTR